MEVNDITKLLIIGIICIFIVSIGTFIILNPDPSTIDSDNDGIMDDKDVFPDDKLEQKDSDGDGIGDNEDKFPNDPSASVDSDYDGYPDYWNDGKSQQDSTSSPQLSLDAFPYDPTEHSDRDGDKVGDNSDEFPDDPTEQRDDDHDGIGNNKDKNPYVNLSFSLNLEKFMFTKNVDLLPWAQIYFVVKINGNKYLEIDNNGDYWRARKNREQTIDYTFHYDIDDATSDDATSIEIIMYDHDIIFQDDLVDINNEGTKQTLNLILNHNDNTISSNNKTTGEKAMVWYKIILPEEVSPGDQLFYNLTYTWGFHGKTHTLNLQIPYQKYSWFVDYNISRSPQNFGPQKMKLFVTTHDTSINELTEKLLNMAAINGYNKTETVNFILAFVQNNIRYEEDSISEDTEEYWRFPIETLVDGQGDCEDSSILFQSIIENTDFDAVMLFYVINDTAGHLSSGVNINENIPGYYVEYNNQRYYYCETTSRGFYIGEKPDEIPDDPEIIIDV